jgi:hypothetical protein
MAEVTLTAAQTMQVFDALSHARRHLVRRDEMNAELHLAEPRWSALTTLLGNAEDMLGEVLMEQAIIGAPIQHDAHPSSTFQGARGG